MEFYFSTENGIVADGKPVANFVVREISRQYAPPRGYEHTMEATILGATVQFTLSADERQRPEIWVPKALGPGAQWDKKQADLLNAAIARASELGPDGIRAEQKPEYFNSPEGLRHNGLLLTDAQLQGLRKVAVTTETGFAPGLSTNGVEKRTAYEVTWLHKGQTKRTVITPSDLTNPSGIVAALGDGAVCQNQMRLACHLGKLIQEAE